MNVLFGLLAFAAFVVFIIGMIKPNAVVFWSKKKSRGMACLYLIAIFVFAAISGASSTSSEPVSAGTSSTQGASVGVSSPATSSSQAPESAIKADTENGQLGDYNVSIESARVSKDYENKPVVIVKYKFTNNSEDATSFATAIMGKVFQDGVQLETAVVTEDKEYNANNYTKDIKKGISLEVECAYSLSNNTSPVEVEATELISFSDEKVTKTFDLTK